MLLKLELQWRIRWAATMARIQRLKPVILVLSLLLLLLLLALHSTATHSNGGDHVIFLRTVGEEDSERDWALHVTRHQKRIESQGGQDGSLEYIFSKIGTTNKYYVEFGYSNNEMEGGTGANTYYLYRKGWTGLLLDGGYANPKINLQKLWIKPETIVQELRARGVPDGTDYISIDIDSADCFVFRQVACEMRPRVMTVEYNSNLPFESTLANMGGEYMWNHFDRLYGCALGVHVLIAQECEYEIVDVVPKLDVVLVRKDLLKGTRVPSVQQWRKYTNLPIHFPSRASEASKYMCAYEIYMKTKDFAKCSGAAVDEQIERLGISFWNGWYKPFG